MSDYFIRILPKEITKKKKKKKKKTSIEWYPFLRAKALQGFQIQIKVIV